MARATFGEAVKAAKAADPSSSNAAPPDGQYTTTVTSGNVLPTRAGDGFRLGFRFVVDSGPEVGKSGWNSQMLRPDDDMNVRIFSRMCESVGVDPATDLGHLPLNTPEDVKALLELVCEKAIGARCRARFRTKNDRSEVAYVDPLPPDAPPSQLQAAKAGLSKVAEAMKPATPRAAGPKRPGHPAI